MELWIRSQDKKMLIKNDALAVEPSVQYEVITNGFNILGKYQSEKRALEVLDEIQTYISEKFAEVYDMPEE